MKRAIFIITCNYPGNKAGVRELHLGEDMVDFGSFFIDVAGYDERKIVQDQPREVVLAELETVAKRLSSGDLLLIYFAGHGLQAPEHLLVLPPGKDDPDNAKLGFLPVQELRRHTDRRGLDRALILDCCRNNDAAASPVVNAAAAYTRRVSLAPAEVPPVARNIGVARAPAPAPAGAKGSFAIFCACTHDDVAPELGATGKGLFSTALRRVLRRARDANRAVKIDDALRDQVEREMVVLAKEYKLGVPPKPYKEGNATPEIMPRRSRRRVLPVLAGLVALVAVGVGVAARLGVRPDAVEGRLLTLINSFIGDTLSSRGTTDRSGTGGTSADKSGTGGTGAGGTGTTQPSAGGIGTEKRGTGTRGAGDGATPVSGGTFVPPSRSDLERAIAEKLGTANEYADQIRKFSELFAQLHSNEQSLTILVNSAPPGSVSLMWGDPPRQRPIGEAGRAAQRMKGDYTDYEDNWAAKVEQALKDAEDNVSRLTVLAAQLQSGQLSVKEAEEELLKVAPKMNSLDTVRNAMFPGLDAPRKDDLYW